MKTNIYSFVANNINISGYVSPKWDIEITNNQIVFIVNGTHYAISEDYQLLDEPLPENVNDLCWAFMALVNSIPRFSASLEEYRKREELLKNENIRDAKSLNHMSYETQWSITGLTLAKIINQRQAEREELLKDIESAERLIKVAKGIAMR